MEGCVCVIYPISGDEASLGVRGGRESRGGLAYRGPVFGSDV